MTVYVCRVYVDVYVNKHNIVVTKDVITNKLF